MTFSSSVETAHDIGFGRALLARRSFREFNLEVAGTREAFRPGFRLRPWDWVELLVTPRP